MKVQRSYDPAIALLGAIAAAMSVGCARPANLVVAQPVGPAITTAADAQQGELVVYTDSNVDPDPAQAIREPGTGRLGFTVTDPTTGLVVRAVATGSADAPTLKLSPGQYEIRAESISGATVQARVYIEAGKATELFLDGSRTLPDASTNSNAVLAPDGSFIGWRSASL